jgi:hypothetical protein
VGLPMAALQYGRYLQLCGRQRDALKWLRRAEQAATQLSSVYERGLALYRLGLVSVEPEATAQLRQAREMFRRIGAPADEERCAVALTQRGESAAA